MSWLIDYYNLASTFLLNWVIYLKSFLKYLWYLMVTKPRWDSITLGTIALRIIKCNFIHLKLFSYQLSCPNAIRSSSKFGNGEVSRCFMTAVGFNVNTPEVVQSLVQPKLFLWHIRGEVFFSPGKVMPHESANSFYKK